MFPFGIEMTKRPFHSDPLSVADALRSAGAIKHTSALTDAIRRVEMANALTAVSKALRPQTNALAEAPQSQPNSLAGMAKQVEMASALAAVSEQYETLRPQVTALAAMPAYVPTRPQTTAPSVTRGSRVSTAEELGARIRQRRQALGMTQQDVADAAGTGRRFVSELEAGKPTLEIGKILDVCQAIGLDLTLATR